jgi:hypothetical protein
MTKHLTFGLILICLATSCNQNKPQTLANELSNFASPYDTLATISLPISMTPESWNNLYSKHIDEYGLPANTDIFLRPYAKLHSNKFYKAIIFISKDETGAPLLISLDKNNNKISELNLLGDWNSNDPSKHTNEIVVIDKDLTISLIDSIKTYDTTIDGDRIESSEKLTIKNESFSISEKGEFMKSSNH